MEDLEEATPPLPQYAEVFGSSATLMSLEEIQGLRMASDFSDVSGHSFVLSYAPPDVVRQAKLEAMALKVRRKMLECKVSLKDPFALTTDQRGSTNAPGGGSGRSVRVSAKTSGVGSSPDLVQSLVVPPSLTAHGEEVRGSSEVILAGQRREYQQPWRPQARGPRGPMPHYRMHDLGDDNGTAGAGAGVGVEEGGKGRGTAAGPAAGSSRQQLGGGAGPSPGRGVPGWAASRAAQSDLATQLSEGMLTYVPSRFERPQGVERTAFVTQAQAIREARSKYESVKRRPSSAPPRRSTSMAVGMQGAGPGGQANSSTAGLDAGNAGEGSQGGEGEGGCEVPDRPKDAGSSASASGKEWWRNMPLVRVEEIDLLATYRQNSQHLRAKTAAAAPEPQPARTSSTMVRATIQAVSCSPATAAAAPAADKLPGSASASATGADGRAREGLASAPPSSSLSASSQNSSRRQLITPAGAAAAELHAQGASVEAGAGSEDTPRPGTELGWGPAAGGRPRSPVRREVTFSRSAAAAAVGSRNAWGAPAASPSGTSHEAGPKPGPASPQSPSRSLANTHSASAPAHRAAAPAAAAPAAAAPGARRPGSARTPSAARTPTVWHSPRPPSQRPTRPTHGAPQRRTSAPAAAAASCTTSSIATASHTPRAAADHGRPVSGGSGGGGGGGTRGVFQPVDPETRRALREQQCGAAIGTGKSSRRVRPGSASLRASFGGSGCESGSQLLTQPAWATSSCSFGGGVALDRYQLQERILDGLVRQYTLEPDEVPHVARAGVAAQGSLQAVTDHDHDPAYPQPHQQHLPLQQQQKATRPQSAPSRRVRPPSGGSWAGRPEPEALRSALLSHRSIGVAYDPELQPSPLDSYMNQLVGLD